MYLFINCCVTLKRGEELQGNVAHSPLTSQESCESHDSRLAVFRSRMASACLIEFAHLFLPTWFQCGRKLRGIGGKTASGRALTERWGTDGQNEPFARP